MTTRNLEYALKPRSVALIGASQRENSVGRKLFENLLDAGFAGPVMPVNPNSAEILGRTAYASVADLPSAPDLAVIATRAATVPSLVDELGKRGTKAAIVISAGFTELGDEGALLQQAMLDAARPHLLRVVGPNCIGVLAPGGKLNASFAPLTPRAGNVAFVTQSGALLTAVLDWADSRGIGFSHLVSLGSMADVDFGDMLDYLANDDATHAILLYVEAITHARKFMSAARAAARSKPVIVCKAGRHAEGARAARSHSGALAGSDAVYDAAFRRAGMLRVYALEELFDAVEMLAIGRHPAGERLAIVTNGGGMGILATDRLIDEHGRLAALSEGSIARLNDVLPRGWSRANPVDLMGDAGADRYRAALEVVVTDPNVDATLVLNCPVAVTSSLECARAVVEAHAQHRYKPLLASWVGGDRQRDAEALLREHRVPTYATPEEAVRAFMYLVNYRRNQSALLETPPAATAAAPDRTAARRIVADALQRGGGWLDAIAARAVIGAYGIPIVASIPCATADDAAAAAIGLDCPVALKIRSPDITHKTDVGGVILDLADADAVRAAASAMLARVASARPDAHDLAFTVEPMVPARGGVELIVGGYEDAQFGPVIVFGHGGTAAEVRDDVALGLPPLNLVLAHAMIARTRVRRLLEGYRGREPLDLAAAASTLLAISQLIIDLPEVVELDVNPLYVDAKGATALDARVRVAAAPRPGTARLAISPYPDELEETVTLADGHALLLRPIRPEDEPALHAAFAKLTAEEIRMRFFVAMQALPHPLAARFTQIDYDREMALVLTPPGPTVDIWGVVRIHADPDLTRAEFAILVRHEFAHRGLGTLLMQRIIAYAKTRGIGELFGLVLRENRKMLQLSRDLGFVVSIDRDDPAYVSVTLALR
jgi:acetyltransferase